MIGARHALSRCFTGASLAVLTVGAWSSTHTAPADASACDPRAAEILEVAGVQGGLVVHLGCGDGKLTAQLAPSRAYLVQGLDVDAGNVAKAREHIRDLDRYGPVSVDCYDGKHLPYADDLANLLVVSDPGEATEQECLRILAPRGVMLTRAGGEWKKTVQPWPGELDEWTHFLHDASNNAVAQDARVGPPRRLRWVCGPLWSRSHEFNSSLCAMVSANGRVFYIVDEGLTSITTPSIPERWTLIARDAFNGVELWRLPVPKWGSQQWRSRALRSIPGTVPRRIVAQGDRVYVTLGYDAPVSVLDAATGKVLMTLNETENTEELRLAEGVLLVRQQGGPLTALDARTCKPLWQVQGKVRPMSLAAHDGKVFYQDGGSLVCVRLTGGQEIWRVKPDVPAMLLVAHGNRVVLMGKSELAAVSADNGEALWTQNARPGHSEVFVANGTLWHWEGERIAGRSLETGEVRQRLDTSDVFSPGHHLRCYQSKATERFLITPFRGVEFVSVTGGKNTQNDWVRGPCRYGIMPCNGLVYVPPHPCFCYPGVKLTGFNALAPKAKSVDSGEPLSSPERLQRGPAYDALAEAASAAPAASDDWPTYRHDPRRTGAAACQVPAEVAPRWRVEIGGRVTPPVIGGGRVFVAAKDRHTLHALSADDGEELWQFAAGARIDSPPTLDGPRVLFGCADGRVYCLRASDGALAWRFSAAPRDRRIVAFGQLESPWRVHGSLLVKDGVAYGTAGRSSYLDGGIRLFGLDAATGRLLHDTCVDTWSRTRVDAEGKPIVPAYHMEGARSDVLVCQDDFLYLGQCKFDLKLRAQDVPYVMPDPDEKVVAMDLKGQPFVAEDAEPRSDYEKHQRDWLERTQKGLLTELREEFGGINLGDRQIGLHVFSTAGFLDDTWFNRTFWMYGKTWPGFYIAHRASKTGQILVVGPERTYALVGYPSRNLQSPLFTPGERGYLLQADANDNEPVLDDRTRGTTKGWGFTRGQPPVWHAWIPIRVRGMVLAGENLYVAGPRDEVDPSDPLAAFEGRRGAVLRAVRSSDGKTLGETKLRSPPVFDGLAAASGGLFLCTEGGEVVCLSGR